MPARAQSRITTDHGTARTHFIHLDDWPSSPVYSGSDVVLRSGMALQLDIIPATGSVYHTSNIEDGWRWRMLRFEIFVAWPT